MSAARFEIVHTGPYAFHARFVAANNEIWWVTESYRTRRSAMEAVALLVAHCADDGMVGIRGIDERGKP